jgi:hypothetical protein
MALMGHTPPEVVDLELIRLTDDETVLVEGVRMTEAKRNAIRDSGRGKTVAPVGSGAPSPPATLDRAQALADLDQLAARLEDQFAYLHLKNVDLGAELDRLRAQLPTPVPTGWLADRIHALMMRFGDGHARASSIHQDRSQLFPPALLVETADGVVAIRPDRSGFLDPERPYVRAIDGEPIEAWVAAVRPQIAAGSTQLVRARALRQVRELQTLRRGRGLPALATVRYSLAASPNGKDSRETQLALTSRRPAYGVWPRKETRELEGQIGYLRLPRMEDERIPDLRAAMTGFRETRGLVVDVRGNGGGSRGLLVALAGYLVGPGEGPWVANVAAYKRSPRFASDHLDARFMRRADDPRWTPEQRDTIEAAAAHFEPEWTPRDNFSAWHYLVLDRTGAQGEYFYDRPVVVLSDASCFSATDIFLAALAGRPRVTLMGTASSGGSARSQGFKLEHSGIEVRCASMASFRPDGRLYDGRGVEVDVVIAAEPTD